MTKADKDFTLLAARIGLNCAAGSFNFITS
jgi:hypothetical protein